MSGLPPRSPEQFDDFLTTLLLIAFGSVPFVGAALHGSWDQRELGLATLLLVFAGRELWREEGTRLRGDRRRERRAPIHVPCVPGAEADNDRSEVDRMTPPPRPRRSAWADYAASAVLVALAALIGSMTRAQLSEPDHVMLFLVAIAVVGARFGRAPSVAAAALSVAAYDYFLVEPYYTFVVANPRHLLTFAMMFATGVFVSTLTLRVRERERAAARALLERERLAEHARIEEMRSSLLSAVSHDLRTPLAAVAGAASALRDPAHGVSDPRRRHDLVDTIAEEAARLERLVRNLLDMTRLDSAAIELRRDWVPLDELIGSALGRLDGALVGRDVTTDLPDELTLLPVDPVLLEHALVNLLENAAKHTPQRSPLEIRARARAHEVVIEIADHGPGIAPELRSRIFEKFVRGSAAPPPGAGLGLAICKAVVEAHGGSIAAIDREGGGAVFRVTLPIVGQPPELELGQPEAAPGSERA